MKRYIRRFLLALMLALAAVPALPDLAEARRGGGFSRSFGGGRSFGRGSSDGGAARRSWGSARPGGYQRKGGIFGSSRRGGAFGRSRGGAVTNSLGRRKVPSAQATPAARQSRAASYKQQHQQPTTVINNSYYGGGPWGGLGWGMYSVGMWDLFFLSTVNHLFWYHHWHDPGIQRALREENLLQKEELEKLEARVKELEAKGVERDPSYLPEDVPPDVAYSKEYVEQNPGEVYADPAEEAAAAEPEEESGAGLWLLLGLASLGALFYFTFVRRF
jgi:hypothetical protein